MNPTRTETIKRFLEANTHPDLAKLYNYNMECQVNVAKDDGIRADKTYKGRNYIAWTDGVQTWKPFRIPYNAKTNPEYEDVPMSFDFGKHVEAIGMTGWDWVNKQSLWFGFDFDGIIGHSEKHSKRLDDNELNQIKNLLANVPWVTLRKSTSGTGLHLYIFAKPVHTKNHNEHAALARAILGQLSATVGFDFSAKVDVCGYNMWIWHRKMAGTDGLILLKEGGILTEIPTNWKEHIDVIKGQRKRSIPHFIANQIDKVPDLLTVFEELTTRRSTVDFDTGHRTLLDWLTSKGYYWSHGTDQQHMIVTHTWSLREAHRELNLKGVFETVAEGTAGGQDWNCFMFPLRHSGWVIRRFTPGCQEANTWSQDSSGWTRCFLNKEPGLDEASRVCGGLEHPTGGYNFQNAGQIIELGTILGAEISIPNTAVSRSVRVKEKKDDKISVIIDKSEFDNPTDWQGWISEGKSWKRVYRIRRSENEDDIPDCDDIVRHTITASLENAGWYVRSSNQWVYEPMVHVKVAMKSMGLDPATIDHALGVCVLTKWSLVNKPFELEYPGNREWNKDAPQLTVIPNKDSEERNFPHWLMLLDHIGTNLDDSVKDNVWCRANSILTGSDYLKCWVASLFQYPGRPLPYLFLYSEQQDTGKSILHEGLSLLMTKGVQHAKTALTTEFNGELANAVLCVIEEMNLGKGLRGKEDAYSRIKDWVTAPMISIHEKRRTPYLMPNTTHWIQCSNNPDACPIFKGDTRIVMIEVNPLDVTKKIPKTQLLAKLKEEAADFLGELLLMDLPPSNDRLNIPVLETDIKEASQRRNNTIIDMFIEETAHRVDGEWIRFGDFYDKFVEWLPEHEKPNWSKIRLSRELPLNIAQGRSKTNNQKYLANISWEPPNGQIKNKITSRNEKLYRDGAQL